MAGMKAIIQDAKADDLSRVVECADQRYLCFTHASGDTWTICVSDGIDVWRLEMDQEDLETHRDLSGISSDEAFLNKFRLGFQSGDISVAQIGNKVSMTIGSGTNQISLDLFEARAGERRAELQTILFRLADNMTSLDTKLTAANHTIEQLREQKGKGGGGGGMNALMDLGPKNVNTAKIKPTKTGMSVVNPTSKKRKAAQGVVFD